MAQLDTSTNALQAALAGELRRVRIELEKLAEVLVGDVHFATTYLDQLQVFDFLGQCADESAAVLDRLATGVAPEAAVTQVRLDVMVDRLRSAMATERPSCAQAA